MFVSSVEHLAEQCVALARVETIRQCLVSGGRLLLVHFDISAVGIFVAVVCAGSGDKAVQFRIHR